jgi:fatty acid desaturase
VQTSPSTAHATPRLRDRARPILEGLPSRQATAAVLQRRMRVYGVVQVLDIAILMFAPFTWLKVLTAVAFAMYRTRTIWTIIHNRVHQPKLPVTPSRVFYDFCTGWIAIWWRKHHLAHHANTNTERDPDTTLFVGRDMNAVRRPPRTGWRRWAGFLGTLAQYPPFFAFFFYRSLERYGRAAFPFVAGLALYALTLWWLLPPWEARLNTLCNFGIGTLYIVGTFAPTHTASAANFDLGGSFEADQVRSTNNVWPGSALYSWLCGGINQHIEHHLFPHVPSDQLGPLVPVVQRWADEQGLPYHHYSPWGIWRAHLRFLRSF